MQWIPSTYLLLAGNSLNLFNIKMPSLAGHFFSITMVNKSRTIQFSILASTAILILFSVLYPGASGQFQLDDWGSLPRLFDDIKVNGFWHGVFDGNTGPTGRPIALLSFALQSDQWDKAYQFKLFNIIIHFLNSVLVGIFTYLLMRNFSLIAKHRIPLFALAVAFIWAILPIQVSTVLYVVQRMVLLSTMFTLLAFIGYLLGRQWLVAGRLGLGYSAVTLSVAVFSLLALLSKEIGFLTVFYIWVIEQFVNKHEPIKAKFFTLWKTLFFIVPLVAFFTYILINAEIFFVSNYQERSFSLGERILTQPRVLWSYVGEILLPQASNLSLYHEDYPLSESLFNPAYTFFAIIAWLSLLIVAYRTRNRFPIVAFCVLWFLVGHALESSFISLEIYFEHRNYLPAYALVFALVYLIFVSDDHIKSKRLKPVFRFTVISYCILLLSITYKQSDLWGKPLDFAFVGASEHPQSLRARSLLVNTLSQASLKNQTHLERLKSEINRLQNDFAGIASIELYDLVFRCYSDEIKLVPINSIEDKLLKAPFEYGVIKLLNDSFEEKIEQQCDNIPYQYLENVLLILLKNPAFLNHASEFKYLLANIYLQQKNYAAAIDALSSIKSKSFSTSMHLARLLATDNKLEMALQELESAEKLIKRNLNYINNRNQLIELRNIIKGEINTTQ